MKKLLLFLLLLPSLVFAQSVQQSGNVTRNHLPAWVTSGVISDGGSSAESPISSLGVTNNGGAGICVNSDHNTAAGRQQLCFGAQTTGPATISLQNFGTAPTETLQFIINGTVVSIPLGGQTIISGNGPFTPGDFPCFVNSSGVVQNCHLGTMSTQNSTAVAITGGTITGLPSPVNPTDAAIKSYVDSVATGLNILAASRLTTAAVLPNTPTYSNGSSGVGATLTAGSNTTLTVDGTLANINDVVLVKNQAASAQNGIYTVTTAGSGGAAWVLTRATYFNIASQMKAGSYTFISAGSTNINSAWTLQASIVTVGTDAVNFAQFSNSSGGTVTSAVIAPGTGVTTTGTCTITSTGTCTVNANATANEYSVLTAGAKCDGTTDDASAINTALATALASGQVLVFPAGTCRFSTQLVNNGVSMRGAPHFQTQLQPLNSFPGATSLLLVSPAASADISLLEITGLFIQPTVSGTKFGGRGIDFEFTNSGSGSGQNAGQLWVHHNYVSAGNDTSIYFTNTPNTSSGNNCQGVPATSTIEDNIAFEGITMIQIGDSNLIAHNTIRADSTRNGISVFQVNCVSGPIQGNAGWTIIENNNISQAAGCVIVNNGHSVKIRDNECEGTGAGTTNGSLMDIDGGSGVCYLCELTGNLVSSLTGGTATSLIRLNGTVNNVVENNTLTNGQAALTNDILITGSSTDARIGYNNLTTLNVTATIADSGVGTVGVRQALTPAAGFTNIGSGFDTASCLATTNGSIILSAALTATAVSSGATVIATLPVQCRPLASIVAMAEGTVSLTVTPVQVIITAAGAVTAAWSGTLQQLFLGGIAYPGTLSSANNN